MPLFLRSVLVLSLALTQILVSNLLTFTTNKLLPTCFETVPKRNEETQVNIEAQAPILGMSKEEKLTAAPHYFSLYH